MISGVAGPCLESKAEKPGCQSRPCGTLTTWPQGQPHICSFLKCWTQEGRGLLGHSLGMEADGYHVSFCLAKTSSCHHFLKIFWQVTFLFCSHSVPSSTLSFCLDKTNGHYLSFLFFSFSLFKRLSFFHPRVPCSSQRVPSHAPSAVLQST